MKKVSQLFNPFQTNGIFHRASYNKVRMVHYIYLGVTDYDFAFILCFFSLKIDFVSANRTDPNEM